LILASIENILIGLAVLFIGLPILVYVLATIGRFVATTIGVFCGLFAAAVFWAVRALLSFFKGSTGDVDAMEAIRLKVKAALCDTSLASLMNCFDQTMGEKELRKSGIWGRKVVVLTDYKGFIAIVPGQVGYIGCAYPVSLSMFELSIEAPVTFTISGQDLCRGIPWGDLVSFG
jgi:hypothetical protein